MLLYSAITTSLPGAEKQAGHRSSEPTSARARELTYTHPLGLDSWRKLGQGVVDFVADYYRYLHRTDTPVMSAAQPGFLRAVLPTAPPERGERLEAVLHDVRTHIIPGLSHWQSPRFFAYFPMNTSVASMLADILVSGFGVLAFQWLSSPACTELEQISLEWLAQLLDLPPCFRAAAPAAAAVLPGSASEAVLVALVAARARALEGRPPEDATRLVAYATDQTHSCLAKACLVTGVRHVRVLSTHAARQFAMEAAALEEAVRRDAAAGLLPCFVCATVGTTSSCAVDPVGEVAQVAARHGLWLNVDAAWAGAFAVLPDQRELYFGGLEGADSLDLNPHKGLLTGWECSALYVKDARWVKKALTPGVPEAYLQDKCGGTATSRGTDGSCAADSGGGGGGSGLAAGPAEGREEQQEEGKEDAAAGPGAGSSDGTSGSGSGSTAAAAGGPARLPAVPVDFKDLDVPLGHGRFRGLRLWFVLRLYGAEGLRRLMRHRLLLQDFLADMVLEDPRFELVLGAPPRFGLVCFRLRGSDAANAALLDSVNASGAAFMSHTTLAGRYVVRCAIGGTWTQGRHVEAAWRAVQRCATGVLQEAAGVADG